MAMPPYVRLGWPQHNTTSILCADNMGYLTYVAFPFLDHNGIITYSHYYNTINIWERFPVCNIAEYDEENRQMLPNILPENQQSIKNTIVFNQAKMSKWENNSWEHAVDMKDKNISLHSYPVVEADVEVEPPNIHIHLPIHDASTASYKDVRKLLQWIYHKKFLDEGHKLVVLFADEQLVCRVWHLLGQNGNMWGEILPFPGDLHLTMHVALGIMRIGEEYLLPLAEMLGYKYIKVDFKLSKWSQHDGFLTTIAQGAVAWLHGLIPARHKNISFQGILDAISNNYTISFCSLC